MSTALAKVSRLKPEIRLAQAVSEYEADLSSNQKAKFRASKSQSIMESPDPSDVMRLTAEVDRQISKKFSGRCIGPRFTYFLQGVQQFAALGDLVVGGSQNLVACGVWSLVRMSILSIVNMSTYIEKLSSLFMEIGRSAPRHQALALCYPRSRKLQSYLSEYFIVVVNLCRYLLKFGQTSTVQQFISTMNDAKLNTFRTELDEWAKFIGDEVHLNEAQENSGFRALSKKMFKSATYQQKLSTNLRVLEICSTYDHQTTWKQTRKIGNASFFIQLAEYQQWRDCSDPCTLVFTGKLGSGKSVVLANIVDDLNIFVEKERFVVTYFFCRRDVPESLKARTILGSLARQLLCTVLDLSALWESYIDTSSISDTEEVTDMIVGGFPPSQKAYIVLDGLDECDEDERYILVTGLQKIQATLNVSICASFRFEPHIDLQSTTQRLAATRVLSMPDDNPDIENFVEADLERCLREDRLVIGDPTLILEIQDALLRGSQGMFLWVALQIQSLCSMKTDQAIREALADLPKDLSETFARILRVSGKSDQSLQSKTLKLILAAHRPLTTDELREALSVTPGDAIWDASKVLNDVRSALACCGCLVIVDEEESTVRMVHHSVKQYIVSCSKGDDSVRFSAEAAQRLMADIIVTYLGYGVFGTELSRTKVHLVLAQSAPSGIVQASLGSSSTTRHFAMKLLRSRRQPAFDMSKTVAEARNFYRPEPENGFRFHIYAKSYWQDHILYVSGQDATMLKLSTKLIQDRMSEVSMVSKYHWGHLHWASDNGNMMILSKLLRIEKVHVDREHRDGQTPLISAVRHGYRDIVELLLETGKVEIDAMDSNGLTPLMWAAQDGFKDIFELLLSTGKVKTETTDSIGRTPLILATKHGHADIVELLLSTGKVEVDTIDEIGWTPLMWGVNNGHKDIVEVLLRTLKVEVDTKDVNGQTPLSLAIEHGHTDIVELLLSTGKVEVDAIDKSGRTPLILAIKHGHTDIVELLLSTGKVEVDTIDGIGWTPLMWGVNSGHKDIVELLLRTCTVEVDTKDVNGWTLLSMAIKNGYKDIVELLLSTGKVEVDAIDKSGRTPLILAIKHGHTDIVELLLSTGKVEVDTTDEIGWTPLMWATSYGHKGIVELLLSTGKVEVDTKDRSGWTPLMWGVNNGHRDTVELLLRTGKVDINAKTNNGTTLVLAVQHGRIAIIELLLRNGKIKVDTKDSSGWTPLMWGVSYGHEYIVEQLLRTGKVDINAKANDGTTPRTLAEQSGNTNMVKMLDSYNQQS